MRLLGGLVLLALVGYLLTGVTQVQPGERAVVRRFGRVVDKPGPGLRIGLPYGIDRVDRVPVDLVRRVPVGYDPDREDEDVATVPGQLLTGDYNLVNVQVLIDYAVRDDEIEDYVVQAERVDGVLARAAEAILAEWVGRHKVDEALIRGKVELPPLLVARTQERIAPYRLGVVIQGASVSYLYPPSEVKLAFDDVNRAQTAIRTREHEARQEAARRLREAQTERNRIEHQTAAYVNEQHVLAGADADRFTKRLTQYERLRKDNPNVLAAIWWDEMGRLFTSLKAGGRIDLLDNHIGADGLDVTIAPLAAPRSR